MPLSQLISVSQTTTSPVLLRTSNPVSISILRSTKSIAKRTRNEQQIRAFRFGCWSSYLEPSYDRELKRRYRHVKYKYLESLNRRLAWEDRTSEFLNHFGKGFMSSAWKTQDKKPGGRWVSTDRLYKPKSDPEPKPQTNEHKEPIDRYRRAMHDFMRSRTIYFSSAHSRDTFKAALSKTKDGESVRIVKAAENSKGNPGFNDSSMASSQEYEIDPITNRKVFKNASSATTKDNPINIPVKTYKGYCPQFQNLEPPEYVPTQAELDNYKKPFMYNEPDGKLPEKPDPVEEGLKDYDSASEGYKPFLFREPDGKLAQQPDSVQESLKDYDGNGYKPFFHLEPDGKLPEKPDPVEEGLRDYDDSTTYTAFRYREPDGKLPEQPDPVQESLKTYDTSTNYGAFRFNEPDGKFPERPDPVQESLKDYDATTTYDAAFRFNEPDGKFPESPDGAREALKEYDQKQASMQEHGSKIYNGKILRGEFAKGMSPKSRNEEDTREDLDLLRASDVRAASGISKGPRKESSAEKNEKRQQLEKSFQASPNTLLTYSQDISSKADGQIDQSKVPTSKTDAQQIRDDVLNRVNAKHAEARGVTKEKPKTQAMTGNFVRDFPEEFETSWTTEKSGSGSLTPKTPKDVWGYDKAPKGLEISYKQEIEKSLQKAGKEKTGIGGFPLQTNFSRKPNTTRLQPSLDRITKEDKPISRMTRTQAEVDPYSKTPQGLETSYKEECTKQGESNPPVFVSSYGRSTRKQTGKDRDLVREVRSIYEDRYGKIDCEHRQVPKGDENLVEAPTKTAEPNAEPTIYKILAYDPAMQSISIAETTSIVTDTASALTPTEVLLRLSNPAKFFPHFKPLQSQGYEIVSGSGDVLVFRKVRQATPTESKEEIKKRTTNPIDGMQVATGNFASPTGFVNHDLPVSADPPFKSNIDVRREEPVFSGKTSWQEPTSPKVKKGGRMKRVLLGGAVVGGGSYAVGVVSEFFRTGGMDGKGPQGF